MALTVRDAYNIVFSYSKALALNEGVTEDTANRIATLSAVKSTWDCYNALVQDFKPSGYSFNNPACKFYTILRYNPAYFNPKVPS